VIAYSGPSADAFTFGVSKEPGIWVFKVTCPCGYISRHAVALVELPKTLMCKRCKSETLTLSKKKAPPLG